MLRDYDRVLPGMANRIVSAWETETRHRRDIETRAVAMDEALVKNEVWLSRVGMIIAAGIALSFLAAGVYLALSGHPIVGGVVVGVDVVALVTVFVVRARSESRVRTEAKAAAKAKASSSAPEPPPNAEQQLDLNTLEDEN